jgi:diguanylate cyclase (GGDEF)-like protein
VDEGGLVLVIDDDPDVRNVVEMTLQLAGFKVVTASDGVAGLEAARDEQPEAVVLDVMMPEMDGYEVCRQLKADARSSHIPVLMLTAKAQLNDKVIGLEGGADDYVTKPFDADELIARVHAVLRRARQTGSTSPLTGLPGNVRIQQELARRFSSGEPFAVLYADANNFKSLNDQYGWLHGDKVIGMLADVMRGAAREHGDTSTFVGHIGGDDFVVVTTPETVEPIARAVALAFDRRVKDVYEPEDLERGYVEVENRQGRMQKFPLVSVSMGIAMSTFRDVGDHREVVEIATEMKNFAKKAHSRRSNYAIDRRTD